MLDQFKKLQEQVMAALNVYLKVPRERLASFLNLRPDRERKMIILLAVCLLLFVDFSLLIQPVINVFAVKMPELSKLHHELDVLRTDKKNEALIAKNWEALGAKIEDSEKSFVAPIEIPALLENLSRLAGEAGVKITALEPRDAVRTKLMEPFSMVPIKNSAAVGAHELGRFLAALESSKTFFRVRDVRIAADQADTKRHTISVELETYRKG